MKKHTGRLTTPQGKVNPYQSYRILTSHKHPQAIIDHLKSHKSSVIELAKKLQPLLFSQIGIISADKLIKDINAFPSQLNYQTVQQTLDDFIQQKTYRLPLKRLKKSDQEAILTAMLNQLVLFETLDHLFLQKGSGQDIDTLFAPEVLSTFIQNHPTPFVNRKTFDRMINQSPLNILDKIQDTLSHGDKMMSVYQDLKKRGYHATFNSSYTPAPKKP